jgi:hypothetical protein
MTRRWPCIAVARLCCLLATIFAATPVSDASGASARADTRLVEYTDNEYGYAFQFPSDWRLQKPPEQGDAGEVRVLVRSPRKATYVFATVGRMGKSTSRRDFEASQNRDAVVNALIEWTIEQVYKKTSREIGASSMMVGEKRPISSPDGIAFYVSTGHFLDVPKSQPTKKVVVVVAGTHIVPFGKAYIIAFMMVSPLDATATSENETVRRVFNSFHIVRERRK